MNRLFAAATIAGAGLVASAARNFFRPDGEGEPAGKHLPARTKEETLADASYFWTETVLDFREIARIWREPEPEQSAAPLPRPTFKHGEIDRFFSDLVEHRRPVKGARRTIIVKLLKMLDDEGDCPSVVRMNPLEAEKKFPDETFSMLAMIPLYRHTLQVARKCAAKISQEVMLPDILIVSLAHDIGKIPSYHDKIYATGDHPLIAAIILNGIPEYASLANRDELDRIIRGHHQIKTDNPLTEMLKVCDQDVRKEELAMLIGEAMEREKAPATNGDAIQKNPVTLTGMEKPAAKDTPPPKEERANPLGETKSRQIPYPVALELPSWFDADAILAAVKKRINRLETTAKGERWAAVSTNMGLVFANPDGLWAAIKEVSGKEPSTLAADADEGAKRNLLYTVVWELSRVKDAIAIEYVSPKYYTTQVTVVTGSGRGFTTLLVPFRVEAFGESVATLEGLKPPLLQKMVKEIKPKQVEVETCAI